MCADISSNTKRDQKEQKEEKKEKNVMWNVSHVTCKVSLVTCQLRQKPQPETLSLLTTPLCTVGWFAKTQKPKKKFKTLKIITTAKIKY